MTNPNPSPHRGNHSPNGLDRASPPARSLRVVLFGQSIVADWRNPRATSARALLTALADGGHEILALEPRKNQPTLDLLAARGSAPLRAFLARYPALPYRTYDLPTGLERTIWFVRQTATADLVILLDDAPAGVLEEAARLDARHLTRAVWTTTGNAAAYPWADLLLIAGAAEPGDRRLPFGPLVLPAPNRPTERPARVLLVAYDDDALATTARTSLRDIPRDAVSAGAVNGPDWPFVPEVDLPDRYAAALVVVIAGGDPSDPFARARALLPLAAGCQVIHLAAGQPRRPLPLGVTPADPSTLRDAVSAALARAASAPPPPFPAAHDSRALARDLAGAVHAKRPAPRS